MGVSSSEVSPNLGKKSSPVVGNIPPLCWGEGTNPGSISLCFFSSRTNGSHSFSKTTEVFKSMFEEATLVASGLMAVAPVLSKKQSVNQDRTYILI